MMEAMKIQPRPMHGPRRVFRTRVDQHSRLHTEPQALAMAFPFAASLSAGINCAEDFYGNRREFRITVRRLCEQVRGLVEPVPLDYDLAHAFTSFLQVGDVLVTMDPRRAWWPVGVVSGPYQFEPSHRNLEHRRPVQWVGEASRDLMTGAFFTCYGSRALSDVTDIPGQWIDLEALETVQRIVGGKWPNPAWRTKVLAQRCRDPQQGR